MGRTCATRFSMLLPLVEIPVAIPGLFAVTGAETAGDAEQTPAGELDEVGVFVGLGSAEYWFVVASRLGIPPPPPPPWSAGMSWSVGVS